MTQVLSIVFAALFTYGASVSAGVSLLRLLRVRLYRSEILFLGFVVGAACLSLITFLLTACSLATGTVFFGVGTVLLACGVRNWRWVASAGSLPGLPRGLAAGWWVIYGVFGLLYLSNALLPETGPDALAYHVAFPARYLQDHGFSAIRGNLLAGMPQGVDMLFLFALSLGGYSAPAMVHLSFLLTIPFGMASYGRRAGFPLVGAAGALLFFVCPIAGKTGTSAYVDVALATVAFALFYAVQIWREEMQAGLLAPIGVLAGFAFSIKYTAFAAFPYALACVLGQLAISKVARLRPVLIVGAAAAVFALPCLVKNQVMLGNPLFPFANRLFPNRIIQPAFEDEIGRQMRNYNSVRLSEVPLESTIRGVRLTGVVGPVFLLVPLALLALRRRQGLQLMLAAVVFGLPYFANLGTRFLLPCLPFLSLALAMALATPAWLACVVVVAHAVLSYPAVLSRYVEPGAWRLEQMEWPVARYLEETLPEYPMCQEINKSVPVNEAIFSLHGFPQLYVKPQIVFSGQSSLANSYRDTLLSAVLAEVKPTHRYTVSFAAQRVDAVRIEAAGAAPWSVTEMRFNVPRESRWRVRASSNIWEAGAAFDNNPVTKWTAGAAGSEAQFLEVNFGGEVTVDRVWLDGPQPSEPVNVRALLRSGDGPWRAVEQSVTEQTLEAPTRMRRAAIETLKRENLHWLLLSDRDLGAQDFAERGRQWGITLMCRKGRYSLYRFD